MIFKKITSIEIDPYLRRVCGTKREEFYIRNKRILTRWPDTREKVWLEEALWLVELIEGLQEGFPLCCILFYTYHRNIKKDLPQINKERTPDRGYTPCEYHYRKKKIWSQ